MRWPDPTNRTMYLNLIQIAESFGVSENVVEDWIRNEGLPHTPDRGRLLFDRAQVAEWAAKRGLAAQAGFLAPESSALGTSLRLEPLLRAGGIWRDVPAADVPVVFERIVNSLPGATPPVRQLLGQRVRAKGGVTMAPVGGGFALPHPCARITLGRESGTVALLLLREPLPADEAPLDGVPINRLLFFIAPSPRAHLDLLGRLSRLLVRGPLRDLVAKGAQDAEIFQSVDAVDAAGTSVAKPEVKG
jgi:nitrogen PTS system EIIA component